MSANEPSTDPDDASQEGGAVRDIAADAAQILTPQERILHIAAQGATALSSKKDGVIATNNRLIIYRRHLFGQADFDDFQWQDVRNTSIKQGVLSSEFAVETVDGRLAGLGELDKEQARRLYSVCQQMEQEWREKRRVRDMEESRARAGGIVFGSSAERGEPLQDPVERLAQARAMLEQGLISETEYDTLKARILSAM